MLLLRVRKMMAAAAPAPLAELPDPPEWTRDETASSACCVECERAISKYDLALDTTVLPIDEFCVWCARPSTAATRVAALEERRPGRRTI